MGKVAQTGWAEHTSPDGDRDKSEFLGTDNWQGSECYLMEFESSSPGQSPSIA